MKSKNLQTATFVSVDFSICTATSAFTVPGAGVPPIPPRPVPRPTAIPAAPRSAIFFPVPQSSAQRGRGRGRGRGRRRKPYENFSFIYSKNTITNIIYTYVLYSWFFNPGKLYMIITQHVYIYNYNYYVLNK